MRITPLLGDVIASSDVQFLVAASFFQATRVWSAYRERCLRLATVTAATTTHSCTRHAERS